MDEIILHEAVTVLVRKENYEEALGVVETFLAEHDQIDAATMLAFVEQGYIFYKMKRYPDGLHAFDKAIELDPESGAAWVGRALTLYRLKRGQEATTAYQRAQKLAPQDARSLDGMGTILLAAGQPEDALVCFDRALELDPSDIDIVRNRLFALRKLRRYGQLWGDGVKAMVKILQGGRQ